MSMVRIVTRILPPNASTESVSELLTADKVDVPVRTQWSSSGDAINAVTAETTFCKVEAIPSYSDPDTAIAAKCKTIPGLSCLKKSRLRLMTVANPVGKSQPVIKVDPEVLQDGSCSGILLSIPLRIPRSEIHNSPNSNINTKSTHHFSSVHINEPNQKSPSFLAENDDVTRTHSRGANASKNGDGVTDFRCNQCNKSFQSLLHLQYHETVHKTKPQFKCDRCGKKFQGKKKLVLHMKLHEEDSLMVKCPFCEKRFKKGKQLKCHMSVHASELPHQCNVCQERFRYARTLLDHSRQHKREKRFECVVCGTGFHQEALLESHYSEVHAEDYSKKVSLMNGKS